MTQGYVEDSTNEEKNVEDSTNEEKNPCDDGDDVATAWQSCSYGTKAFFESLESLGDDHAAALKLVQSVDSELVNAVDDVDKSILLILAMDGHFDACRVLLEHPDFDLANSADMIGSTALHFAAGNDHPDICRLLLESPQFTVGVNVQNDHGKTPLDFAVSFGDDSAEGGTADIIKAAGGRSGGSKSRDKSRRYMEPIVLVEEPLADLEPPCDNLDFDNSVMEELD